MQEIHLNTIQDFNDYNGMETLHPLVNSSWPKGNPNDAYAQYFTGQSYLAPITPKN